MSKPQSNTVKFFATAFAYGALAFSSVHAADIYRWVDDNGRIQLSDRVPEQYKSRATRIGDSKQYELTPEQRKEADDRAAQGKVRATEAAEREARVKATPPAKPASAASAPASRPASAASAPASATKSQGGSDCESLRKRFAENNECLSPFFIAGGGVKAEGFAKCGPAVPYPAKECSGSPRN